MTTLVRARRIPLALTILAAVLAGWSGSASAIDPSRLESADKNPNDWLTYHGSYRS